MNLINWINKHLEYVAFFAVILSILWIIFGPLILTQHYFSIVDFSDEKGGTGTIGDTIGGITSPVIGLISIILLYLALIKQIESNKASIHEANFRIINSEIVHLGKISEKFTFSKKERKEGFTFLAQLYSHRLESNLLSDEDYQILNEFEFQYLNKFWKILDLLDNLKTSKEYNRILVKDLNNVFFLYYTGFHSLASNWNFSTSDTLDLLKGKMYLLKESISNIYKNIHEHNLLINKK